MLHFLPGPIVGVASLSVLLANTLLWAIPILVIGLIKVGLPMKPVRNVINRILNALASSWISVNTLSQRILTRTRFDVRCPDLSALKKNHWYLVLSNHQSWVDILVLQRIFNRRIPFLKFFAKKELFWIPLVGQVWWILDYPFMKRYSREFLQKNPHLKGRDIAITKKACEKFKEIPISIMNFVEGTRFTPEKHLRQTSPYTHLLKPKAGGVAMVMAAMGEQLTRILNVTIVYPHGLKSFWAFVCGKVEEVKVHVEVLPIGKEILGDYFQDSDYQEKFQVWLNELWEAKDRFIDTFCLPCDAKDPLKCLPEP